MFSVSVEGVELGFVVSGVRVQLGSAGVSAQPIM